MSAYHIVMLQYGFAYRDGVCCVAGPEDAGARKMASDVCMCNDSMEFGEGLCSRSLARFLNEARPNLEDSLSRELDRPGAFLEPEGGGGKCGLAVIVDALGGIAIEVGRLLKPETGRADDGVPVGGGGRVCEAKGLLAE